MPSDLIEKLLSKPATRTGQVDYTISVTVNDVDDEKTTFENFDQAIEAYTMLVGWAVQQKEPFSIEVHQVVDGDERVLAKTVG